MPVRKHTQQDGPFNLEEMRLVSDLRIMHAKVNELHHIVDFLKHRHTQQQIVEYADTAVLADNIRHVDEIYLWFVQLKEESGQKGGQVS